MFTSHNFIFAFLNKCHNNQALNAILHTNQINMSEKTKNIFKTINHNCIFIAIFDLI